MAARHSPRPSARAVGWFFCLWLLTGYSLGTSTLLGPVRWITTACRRNSWPSLMENGAVIFLIVLLVAGSAALAAWLTRTVLRSERREVRFGIPVLAAVAAGAALLLWFQPAMVNAGVTEDTQPGSRFTVGPYPTRERMLGLKLEGYTAIISLLHPAVLPFESALLAQEKAAAESVGISLIHVPMLPWVSENTEALARLRQLASSGTERYYVHCYLGMDRVWLVRRAVGEASGTAASNPPTARRQLRDGLMLERGAVVELDDGVFVTGYLTDEEFMGFVVAGGVKQAVSLLDPYTADDRRWADADRVRLKRAGIALEELPLANEVINPGSVRAAAEKVRGLPRPLIVYGFLAPSTGRAPAADAFVKSYRGALFARLSHFIAGAVPDARTTILLAPALLLAVGLAAGLAGWLRTAREVPTPHTRKVFHFIIFTIAGLLHLGGGLPFVVLFGTLTALAVLYAVWRGDGYAFYEAMARPTDRPRRSFFILVPLATTAVGGLVANFFFTSFAYLGYLVSGWGDAVGEPVGTAWGKHTYRVPSLGGVRATRTLEGSGAVLAAGTVAAIAGLLVAGVSPAAAIGVGAACGVGGALVEAVSHHGLDNFTVQVVATGIAALLLG